MHSLPGSGLPPALMAQCCSFPPCPQHSTDPATSKEIKRSGGGVNRHCVCLVLVQDYILVLWSYADFRSEQHRTVNAGVIGSGLVALPVVPLWCQPWASLGEVPSSVSGYTSTKRISWEPSQPLPQYQIICGWGKEGRMFPFTLQPSVTPRLFVPERLSSDAVLFLVMVFVRHLPVTIYFRRVDVTKPKKK